MKKAKTTKRALLMSVLSMLLCISMLVGSTFAWFTDSVTSGNNKIVAGNLDVELEYLPITVNPDGTTTRGEWTAVPANESLFKSAGETLWEPGHTEYVYLRVRNAGSLALKYQFDVKAYGDASGEPENEYTNVNNEKFRLSQYLVLNKIGGTAEVKNRADLWLDAAEEEEAIGKLNGQKGTGVLMAGAWEEFTLAVYMPTSVGNEANQLTEEKETKGDPTIYLALTLKAMQASSENDSFGSDYDANADGRPDHPDWTPIAANTITAAANEDGSAEVNSEIISASFPAGSIEGGSVTVTIKPTDVPEGITVNSNQAAKAFEISVEGLKEGNTEKIAVKLFVGKNLTGVTLYHNSEEVEDAKYNADTGIVAFETESFSPFTVVRDRIPGEVFTADELKEAVANGGKVVLGADINLDDTITIAKDVTLDLNGKHIEFSEMQTAILVQAGATLTVNDGTNEGYIKSTGLASKSSYTINLDKKSEEARATLVLNGGQIIQNAQYNSSAAVYANTYSVIDVNGGTIMVDSLENYGYCVYMYSYTASMTIDDATLTNNSTGTSATAFYSSGKAIINNSTINSDINLSHNDSQISNSTINGTLGTSTDASCTTIVSNCKINGDFKGSKTPQYGKLVNCTVEGDVYSSAGCISGGKYKNRFDVSWLEEGKIFSTERNADGYFTVVDMPENWYAAKLTYEDTGETSYFRSPIEAYNKANADSSTRGKATLTITKDCAIGKSFYPYNLNKIVVAEGATVTLSVSVSVSASSTTERCTFENNGTVISSSSISGSLGKGYLINNGSMTVSYFSAKTANWVNNGQIILTDGNSSISSSFTNNGTIKATNETIYLEVGANGKVDGTGTTWSEGSYAWSNTSNNFVANGKVFNSTKNSYYLSLSSAVTSANDNDVLIICADLTYNTVTINKTLTVDLNGHTVSYGNSMDSGIFIVTEGGNLTIKDSTATKQPALNADGTVNYTSGKVIATFGVCGVMVKSGGIFTLNSGIIQANSDNQAIAIAEGQRTPKGADNAIVNIKGGLVINTNTTSSKTGDAIAIYGKSNASATNGKYADSDPTLNISGGIVFANHGTAIIGQGTLNNTKINISGGRVYSVDYSAIYHPQYGQMTISGDAIITGVSAVLLKGGELTVSGGTLDATGKVLYLPTSAPGSGSYITGDALYIEDNYNRGIVVTITGGTFKTVAPGAQEYRVLFSGATPAVVNDSRKQA